jgi:serine protease Do
VKTWIQQHFTSKLAQRLIVPTVAVALTAAFVTYETVRPAPAHAAAVPAPATPLSDDDAGALLALDRAMETLAARVTPAVVNVTVTSRSKASQASEQMPEGMEQFGQPDQGSPFGKNSPFGQFFGPQGRQGQQGSQIEHGLGSGVVISPDGYIVTNNHVVEGAVDIRVTTSDRRVLKAKLIGTDPLTDLAVIKVEGANLPSVPWADMADVRPGETVLAFGNPFGYRFTVTRGIVSAINRANPDASDRRKPGEFIQTDAAINPGNSGGPLVDARGEVVGINTFLISPNGSFSGMGFAIPAKIAKPTVATLIQYGKVAHGYMGVGITDVTPDNAKFFHLSKDTGAVLTQVDPDAPGGKAGLKVGDVITKVDGQEVSDAGQLQVLVGARPPQSKVVLTALRDGKEMSIPVVLGDLEHHSNTEEGVNSGEEHGKARWGLALQELTPELRDQIQVPSDVHGALIGGVQPGSSADNAGLQQGDIILEVDRKPVHSVADVQSALANAPKGEDALLLVRSPGGNSFRVLHSPESAS